jgi:hypothetical protein
VEGDDAVSMISRRTLLAAAVGTAVAACTESTPTVAAGSASSTVDQTSASAASTTTPAAATTTASGRPVLRLIGDGSTSDTGPQPHQPTPRPLAPGETPPQFVVFSWDGAGNLATGQFPRFRSLAADLGASMTFFLTGTYALPVDRRELYHPPQHRVGASAIGLFNRDEVLATMSEIGLAWIDGHEIGTHFNGHFCGTNGAGRWSPQEWRSEIDQAVGFVQTWRTNAAAPDAPPLPFDYATELVGGRAPCLEGQKNLLPAAAELGWRYDASSPGGSQVWPTKKSGLWDLPLQSIPFAGDGAHQTLSMDYNLMYKQNGGDPDGDPARFAEWRTQAYQSYLAGFTRALTSNRAPMFIGNHFEQWNGGIYMDAVEQVLTTIAAHEDVRLVSFRQLVDWLDVQDPAVIARLRTLSPGVAPTGGWRTFLA